MSSKKVKPFGGFPPIPLTVFPSEGFALPLAGPYSSPAIFCSGALLVRRCWNAFSIKVGVGTTPGLAGQQGAPVGSSSTTVVPLAITVFGVRP
ncbi:hypothetical protein [Mesorhizobium silamurunense]|uniref:hypothetical protein n=1 Tax=Mesorhizobium silamurunense TaxID=499528 RepID=UPI00177EA68D|nr:hypothetical protein [Mesorhizobium silamurunense]